MLAALKVRLPLLLAAGLTMAACAVSQSRVVAPAAARHVKVKVKCGEDRLEVSVKPFAVAVGTGESVFWVPDVPWYGGRNDVQVSIVPKDPANWPFREPPPTMPVDEGVPSGQLSSDAPNTVGYNLRFQCPSNGVMRTIVVDPDIIISGGSVQ